MIATREIIIDTDARMDEGYVSMYNITPKVLQHTAEANVTRGTLTLFLPGTTASLSTIEWEDGLLSDFKKTWQRLVPQDAVYSHKFLWDENNAYSHIRATMMGASLVIPIVNKKLTLGKYQQIVMMEFDNRARKRQIILQFAGE